MPKTFFTYSRDFFPKSQKVSKPKKNRKNPANKSGKNTQIKLEITLVKCKTTKTC